MGTPAQAGRRARQIKVRELHILSTVVQAGSMAKAAVLLSMTQPTVSEAIANLEALLQVRLLDRNSRGVEPTIYGQALLRRGRVVLDELGQAVRDIEFLADPAGGEVRIGCPEAFSAGLVPAIIERISRSHPQLAVHVVDANTAFLEFRQLRERNVDLMLGRISRTLQDEDLNVEILFEESLYVVVGSQNKWARRRQVALADLIGERWILAEPNHVVRSLMTDVFRAQGLDLPKNVTTGSMHLRLHLLARGDFVTVLPETFLRYHSDRWPVKRLPIDLGRRLPVAVVTLKTRTLSPATQVFIAGAREIARSPMQGSNPSKLVRRD